MAESAHAHLLTCTMRSTRNHRAFEQPNMAPFGRIRCKGLFLFGSQVPVIEPAQKTDSPEVVDGSDRK